MLYMLLADGFEETEAIGALDVIRRADIDIKTVGVTGRMVCGTHGVKTETDIDKSEVNFSVMSGVILPGGMPGTTNLERDGFAVKTIEFCVDKELLVAAICAAPMILGKLGILNGKNAVCYPGFEKYLSGANICTDSAITDGNIITGKGAGAAMLFGAEIVNYFKDGAGTEVLKQMQHRID